MSFSKSVLAVVILAAASGFAEDNSMFRQSLASFVRDADEIVLYSIDFKAKDPKTTLHGFAVLGSTQLADKKVKTRITQSFAEGISQADEFDFAFCFYPRHALRVKNGDRTLDLMICFECKWVWIFRPDTHKVLKKITVQDKPSADFNAVLIDAKIDRSE